MDEMTLERLLARAAAATEFPTMPQLTSRVVAAISTRPSTQTRPTRFRLAFALAAMIAAVAATLAVPSSRSAIADFFGIEGSKIERLPTPAPGTTPTPFPTPADISAVATPIALDAAAARLSFEPALPPGERPPTAYFVPFVGPDPFLVLQFERFDLWEGRLEEGFVKKWFGGTTVLQELTIRGQPGRWLSGGSHIVTFQDGDGNPLAGLQRTVDRNTLVWRTPYAFYRIETDLTLDETIRIAESLP